MKLIKIASFTTLLLLCLRASAGIGVQEIPNPNLGDIAMVTVDNWGNAVIVYNPVLCQQMGSLLCEFYRWHEYGHIMMGHTIIPKWPQVKELEADCWAARNAPHPVLQAAYQWFIMGGGSTPIHGFGQQRAASSENFILCWLLRTYQND